MKIIMKKIHILASTLLAIAFCCACESKKTETATPVEEDLTEITPEQFTTNKMALGRAAAHTFSTTVVCKGTVFAPANAMSKISPSIAGKVITITHKLGDRVQAGQVIATLSGNDFMELQQSFAEAAAAYTKAKVDYERAKSLWAENIGAEKDFLAAKSLYHASLASYQSLRSRVAALRLNPARIENGHMYTSYPVVAPISGYLTNIDAVIGQFVDMESNLVEIVDVDRLQLKLQVYQSDIRQLRVGQTVNFTTTDQSSPMMRATLSTIGKTVDPDTKTIECVATISHAPGTPLINESFVQASIVTGSRQGRALPTTAVQKTGNTSYVYYVQQRRNNTYLLKKIEVTTGAAEDHYTEIINPLPNKEIVVQGVETLQ